MSESLSLPTDLAGWLAYIEALHPKSIAMGLARVEAVKNNLQLNPTVPVILVGGTNGKGSTCAMLERIYHEAGYKVGCYTSPHLLHYNERVRVDCHQVSDDALCSVFRDVENARRGVELTYFEFGTLAAVKHFMDASVDLMILEVGLGGRLDAVNVFEPSCSIVVSVDLDHMEFLGNTRESIGFEKAGIFRAGKPAICGDIDPPLSLSSHAKQIGADLYQTGHAFNVIRQQARWTYRSANKTLENLPVPALTGDFQLDNAACVIAAIEALKQDIPVTDEQICQGLEHVILAGRFQSVSHHPEIILDVAHNPHAAKALAKNLDELPPKRTLAVFGMLADKDIAGVLACIKNSIDFWYLADVHHPRGATARQLQEAMRGFCPAESIKLFANVSNALNQACLEAGENDRIVVFGSFFTVADAMHALPATIQNY